MQWSLGNPSSPWFGHFWGNCSPVFLTDIIIIIIIIITCVSGSSVGIATDYGLDGPRSNPGENEIFRPSRPALGLTQPPVKWAPALSWG